MRGLEEIRKINEDPRAARTEDALFAGYGGNRRDAQRFHGERVEARQAERHTTGIGGRNHADLKSTGAFKSREAAAAAAILGDIMFTAFLLDVLNRAPIKEPEPQERITPFDANEPPFFKFWQKLNDALARQGKPEAAYGTAREAFTGGKTPVGALTFIGKEFDGLRAVPAEPVQHLGGTRPTYHGEYREVSEDGTRWHKVVNGDDRPICYALPEAALVAAKDQRASIEKAFH